jgi:hypothetical protein
MKSWKNRVPNPDKILPVDSIYFIEMQYKCLYLKVMPMTREDESRREQPGRRMSRQFTCKENPTIGGSLQVPLVGENWVNSAGKEERMPKSQSSGLHLSIENQPVGLSQSRRKIMNTIISINNLHKAS